MFEGRVRVRGALKERFWAGSLDLVSSVGFFDNIRSAGGNSKMEENLTILKSSP